MSRYECFRRSVVSSQRCGHSDRGGSTVLYYGAVIPGLLRLRSVQVTRNPLAFVLLLSREYRISSEDVNTEKVLQIRMAEGGGFVVIISPLKP